MPPASILFPGLDGKAGPTRDLPAPTAPLGRKPNSPLPLGNAVRGVGPRGTEAATGCRMSWSGSEGSVCYSPPPDGPEGAGEALHTVLGLLQIAVALPAELVRHSPSRSGNPPAPFCWVKERSHLQATDLKAWQVPRRACCWGPLLRASFLCRAEDQ